MEARVGGARLDRAPADGLAVEVRDETTGRVRLRVPAVGLRAEPVGHLQSMHVAVDDEVEFRQELGMVGNTGRSTSRHLHYEILIDDRVFDPARFLNASPLLIGVLDIPRRTAEAGR